MDQSRHFEIDLGWARTYVSLTDAGGVVRPARASATRFVQRSLCIVVLIIVLAACGSTVTPPPSPSASPGLPAPSGEVTLTSPPPQPAGGLADPSTPAYAAGSGFTPDAVKVLMVTSVRIGLERYRAATGSYPASLDALFPTYAPIGQDGKPMSGPPAAADGYAYTGGGTGYQLSVRLASGMKYQVGPP